jgi:beta-galactosidase
VLRADSNWKFFLGDPTEASAPSFNDAPWRTVDLPHDWSIEGAPDPKNATGAGGGYFPAGIGWYRKTFRAPAGWIGKRVSIEFDGVASNATIYLNGQKLGFHPYAYTSFDFDLTPLLKFDESNVLAVRVDCSDQPSSRWYTGSGIYRHVRVVITEPTHVAHWGVFVTTPDASRGSARVLLSTKVANDDSRPAEVSVETTLLDKAGKKVGSSREKLAIAASSDAEAKQEIAVAHPSLWSPGSPVLYRAVSQVLRSGKVIDEVVTPFGIRTLSWSAEKGLLLNGESIKLTGGSVHHDNGPLGAMAFDYAEERKVQLLKAAGHNAVRTAHNPPSPAFLDACDRLGLLVLDEPFDVWKASKVKFDYGRYFDEWWQRDISSLVLRDRNHPSIVIWGIGNEIPELTVERGRVLGKQLADQVRLLDRTRPLTLAYPGSTSAPNSEVVFSLLDITGYNYNIETNYKPDHSRVPSRIMLTTESMPPKAFPLWEISHDNPFVIGEFAWTAMDYLGESGAGAWSVGTPEQAEKAQQMMGMMQNTSMIDQMFQGVVNGVTIEEAMSKGPVDPSAQALMALLFHGYPWHAANCGDIDLTGYRKPQSYYRDILWNGGDRVYTTVRLPDPEGRKIIAVGWTVYPTLPSWTWPGQEGKPMQVEVYSGAEKVRLFLNDRLVGEKTTGREQQFKATFDVPYAPGKLKAVGIRAGRVVAEQELVTTGAPARLKLTADRSGLSADGQDLAYITVEAVDTEGRLNLNADQQVRFTLSGPGAIAGLGNGDGQSSGSYQGDTLTLFHGRGMVVVRSSKTAGPMQLSATAVGLSNASTSVTSRPGSNGLELE